MSPLLLAAIITITCALIFYTIGVWSEHKAGILKKWHVIIFYCGLACDTIGTGLMGHIAQTQGVTTNHILFMIHGLTGLAAILLMLFHAIWATVVLYKHQKAQMEKFHKFSLLVWGIWLIPYVVGMIVGMM